MVDMTKGIHIETFNFLDIATVDDILNDRVQHSSDTNWFMYIIFDCCSKYPLYVGITNNVKRRISTHIAKNKPRGGSSASPIRSYTNCAWPKNKEWKVLILGPYSTKYGATRAEYACERDTNPWYGTIAWNGGVDQTRKDLPWYIRQYFHKIRLKSEVWKKKRKHEHIEWIQSRITNT
jgi:predicted GIY-YIG superfamily endonuclease